MRRWHRWYLSAAQIAALLISCIPLNAQSMVPAGAASSAGADEPGSVLRVNTRLVVVDVVALDKDGKPVTDLKDSDFRVLEDHAPQSVRIFAFKHPAEPGQPGPPKLAANEFTNSPAYRANSSFNVIVLDSLNTRFEDQAYAQAQVRSFIEKTPPGQPVAIYEFTGEKVVLLQDFTRDPALLEAGVRKFKGQNSFLIRRGVVQRAFRIDYMLGGLKFFAQALADYPGRKNLIWVAGEFPFLEDGALDIREFNYEEQLAQAADTLMNRQIAIYPVDAHGLEAPGAFNAERQGPLGGRAFAAGIDRENLVRDVRQFTMDDLASRTGGRSFYNTNDLGGSIGRSIDDGSTYYSLGYYPENKNWNGQFRKIEVKAGPPGITLRYRVGYYASEPRKQPENAPARGDLAFVQSLNLEMPTSPFLTFKAGVLSRSSQTKNKVPVVFGIDPRAIRFEQREGGVEQASVTCGARAYSEKGKPLALQVSTVQVALKPETFQKIMQTNFPCQVLLDLPSGHYQMRLGVADKNTGLTGTTNAQVIVP